MNDAYPRQCFLIVLIAPSGGGKSTVKERIMAAHDRIAYSVSYTTRKPRANERHGEDYFFVPTDEFEAMAAQGEFLEHAIVHGNHYGTSKTYVEELIESGRHVLLDLDVQGARSLGSTRFRTVSIFLLPPVLGVLEQRLVERGSDSPETIALRLKNSREEIASIPEFQYLVINDELDRTVEDVFHIIRAEENRACNYPIINEIFYGGNEC
jgi:guanylate kinase